MVKSAPSLPGDRRDGDLRALVLRAACGSVVAVRRRARAAEAEGLPLPTRVRLGLPLSQEADLRISGVPVGQGQGHQADKHTGGADLGDPLEPDTHRCRRREAIPAP